MDSDRTRLRVRVLLCPNPSRAESFCVRVRQKVDSSPDSNDTSLLFGTNFSVMERKVRMFVIFRQLDFFTERQKCITSPTSQYLTQDIPPHAWLCIDSWVSLAKVPLSSIIDCAKICCGYDACLHIGTSHWRYMMLKRYFLYLRMRSGKFHASGLIGMNRFEKVYSN